MNIIMMSRIFAKSGVGTHIRDLSKQLKDMGNTVYIMSSTNDWGDFCEKEDVGFIKTEFKLSPFCMVRSILFIRRFIKNHRIDVVHVHHRICGVYMQVLSKLMGVPFVWSNHLDDIPYDLLHRKMTFYGKKAICVSSELKKFCTDKLRIPERDVEVIIHGIRPTDYCYEYGYVSDFKLAHHISDEKIVGLFARMAPMKGHSCLIEALAKLPTEKRNKIKTVFLGGVSGEYVESLKDEISRHKLDNCIIFEGFVTPSEALSLSDITVLPSIKEGFGIVSIESFLMRKPHIRTKTAGYEDIKDGCVGFEVGDSDTLSRELEKFVDGKDYSDLTERGYQLLLEKCTLESMTNRILNIYCEICQ